MSLSPNTHITSIWGCEFEASRDESRVTLMECKEDALEIEYNARWKYHIFSVHTKIGDRVNTYAYHYLKHAQRKTICGNEIEFHRYYAGINVRLVTLRNRDISGLFNESSCLSGR